MVQLFQNLVGNALKFNNKQPIINITWKEKNGSYLFSVKDNGIGIETQYFEKIFKIFQRLHIKEKFEGTGIGLALCKRIVERHGGQICADSTPGEGSTFYFSISKILGA